MAEEKQLQPGLEADIAKLAIGAAKVVYIGVSVVIVFLVLAVVASTLLDGGGIAQLTTLAGGAAIGAGAFFLFTLFVGAFFILANISNTLLRIERLLAGR